MCIFCQNKLQIIDIRFRSDIIYIGRVFVFAYRTKVKNDEEETKMANARKIVTTVISVAVVGAVGVTGFMLWKKS